MIACVTDRLEAIGVHLLTGVEHTDAQVHACFAAIRELDALWTPALTPALIVVAEEASEKAWPSWVEAVTRQPTYPMLLALVFGEPSVVRVVNAATWMFSPSFTLFPAGGFDEAATWLEGRRGTKLPLQAMLARARRAVAEVTELDVGAVPSR